MSERSMTIPYLTSVRVLTSAGPYRAGQLLAIAYIDPTLGRLLAHAIPSPPLASERGPAIVPETISATVLYDAEPYRVGDVVTLSFIDPAIARIHLSLGASLGAASRTSSASTGAAAEACEERALPQPVSALRLGLVPTGSAVGSDEDVRRTAAPSRRDEESPAEAAFGAVVITSGGDRRIEAPAVAAPRALVAADAVDAPRAESQRTLGLRLAWSVDRATRFVKVVDRLFTVDRLGWYRHVLANRLLVAEELSDLGDRNARPADLEAASAALRQLRTSGLDALGAPLLASYLPGFCVTSEWLATLENGDHVRASRAFARAEATLGGEPADDRAARQTSLASAVIPLPDELIGRYERSAHVTPETTFEFLPSLIPTTAADAEVSVALEHYRRTLGDLFSQIGPGAQEVRIRQMTQPCPALDDRLWLLAGSVQQSLATREVARGA